MESMFPRRFDATGLLVTARHLVGQQSTIFASIYNKSYFFQDAKANCDQIERELHKTEEVIKVMFNDVQVLRDNRYGTANELHRR